ncbi:hypothetical protein JRI60_20635 [Archangium violaceum]|uniref:tetratricopeptide repeat protein n=1 Tax=Archangium violaceum TaxID=83451 RepID=UPI0019521625|nr:hypothetical protein [Archangium violaceum]QRO01260.1 hypothetical protein JRI60_20635 [Archangium violaceum]
MPSRGFQLLLALLLLLVAMPAVGARPALPPTEDVMKMLREIQTARLRGGAPQLARDLEASAEARPSDPMPRIYKAWLSFPADTCWNELKAVSVLHPENPWPHVGMGIIYVRWGLHAEARASLAAAVRIAPGFPPALWGEALLLQAESKPVEAEARLREALSRLDVPQLHTDLGLMLARRPEQEAEARAELARSVAAWPEQPEALETLARLARAAKDARQAAEVGELLVSLRPQDLEAHRAQGEAWLALGEREKAALSFGRYVALGGSSPAPLSMFARLNADLGRSAEEEKILTRLVSVDTADAEPVSRLASLAEARGDLAATEQWLLKASERAPKRSDFHARRGRLLVKQERWRDSLEAYRLALAAPEQRIAEAEAEAAAVVKRFRLMATPAKGTQEQIYNRVSLGLVALYMERLKEKPDLKGILKVRVQVDETGHATQVAVVYDSLGDALLAGHAYFAFLDAQYPPGRAEPVFQYVFRPPK